MAIDSAPTAGDAGVTDLAAGLTAALPATASSRPEDLLQQPEPEPQPPDPTLSPEGQGPQMTPGAEADYGQTAPAGLAQMPQQLLSQGQQIQQGWQYLQQRDAAFQQASARLDQQEQLLQSLQATVEPDVLAPQVAQVRQGREQLLQALWQHQQEALQVQQAQGAFNHALKEYQLEQLAGPMSVELLARKLSAEADGLGTPEMQQALRQYLVQFDANGLRPAASVITDLARRMGLAQRQKNGTDQMGGSTSAAPLPKNSTHLEDLAAGLKQAYGFK